VQLRRNLLFDYLAIVVFRPDFNIHAAKLIPWNVLQPQLGEPGADRRFFMLRVTPHLLSAPGTRDIDLSAVPDTE
jgi:hypothetical protein